MCSSARKIAKPPLFKNVRKIVSMEKIQRSTRSKPTIDDDDDHDYIIPDWLLSEVLLLLPLKSLFRCRLVSKRWLSAASDPNFIRAYASRASSLSPHHWIALSPYNFERTSFRPALEHSPSDILNLRESYLRPPPHSQRTIQLNGRDVEDRCSIAGASDGLLLYCYTSQVSDIYFFDFCVCNPITGHRVRPLKHIDSPRNPSWGFLTRVQDFALKSYCIVHVVRSTKKARSAVFSVYRSETGAWHKLTAELGEFSGLQHSAAALDGILYWAETRRGVIAFDPEAEKTERRVRVIRDPHDGERLYPRYSCLCVAHRGELRYFGGNVEEYDGVLGFRVWKLEGGYYGSGEWSLVHKIGNVVDVGMSREMRAHLQIMCFDPLDPDKVYFINGRGRSALSYDMEKGAFDEGLREMIVERGHCARGLKEILVLVVLPWPTLVSEKRLERHV